jgi:hypothetical protein
LEIERIVFHQQAEMPASPDAARSQQMGEAIGGFVQLAIAHCLAAGRHDDGRMVRARLRVRDGVHVSLPQDRPSFTEMSDLVAGRNL